MRKSQRPAGKADKILASSRTKQDANILSTESQRNKHDPSWSGPVFLIGMPRSGTKLLRSLLNQHPVIAIPELETEFFPFWVRHWQQFGDLSDFEVFERFVARQSGFPYFVYARRTGVGIDINDWHRSCTEYTPAEVFRRLIHLNVGAEMGTVVWGDKSPSYTTQIPLLLKYFPSARFILIVRDARDYCLSIHKAWRKNIPRAAMRWRDAMRDVRRQTATMGNRMTRLRYEELLTAPEPVLRRICSFLDLPFDSAMLELAKPSENIGDTRGQQTIVASNTGKYRNQLPAGTTALIEAICGNEMRHWGYTVPERQQVEVPGWKMGLYRIADGYNLLLSDCHEHGIMGALKVHYSALKLSNARRSL